jgi:hypothetical protein
MPKANPSPARKEWQTFKADHPIAEAIKTDKVGLGKALDALTLDFQKMQAQSEAVDKALAEFRKVVDAAFSNLGKLKEAEGKAEKAIAETAKKNKDTKITAEWMNFLSRFGSHIFEKELEGMRSSIQHAESELD